MTSDVDERALDGRRIAVAVAIAIGGVLLFHFFGNATRGYIKTTSLFWWWVSQWLDPNAETEHGWLILGIAGWVWWRNLGIADCGLRIADSSEPETGERKPERCSAVKSAGGSGVRPIRNPQSAICNSAAALLAALALHALGFVGQQTRVSIVALLLFTWGVVRLAGGRRWGSAAVFPLAFMVFAIPLSVLDEIGLPLRLWVTNAGEAIARAGGVEIVRSGTQLIAPDGRFHYDVAAPCSGVRSLMALTALSVLIGYLNFRTWPRRALVFLLCFPLVYLGNVVRIVTIILAAQTGGADWGDRAHAIMGYGVFVIVVAGLLLAVAAIERGWPEKGREERSKGEWNGQDIETRGGNDVCEGVRTVTRSGGKAWTVVGAAIVVLVAGEMVLLHRVSQRALGGDVGVVLTADGLNPVELPAFLGTEWIGQRTEITPVEREILPPDTGFSRKNYAFVADRSRDVFLSIVLSGRDRTSIHRPELCLVGQGWTIDETRQQVFRAVEAGDGAGGAFKATVLRVRREVPSARGKIVVPQLVAYWFVGSDAIVPSSWQRFTHDLWNRITRTKSDRWAYVLMQTDARDGEAAALARMQTVLNGTLSRFQKLPAKHVDRRK